MANRLPAAEDVDWGLVVWVLVGLAVAATAGFVIYSFVGTFVFAVFLYYSARPIYRRIRPRVRPPSLAAGLALFLLGLPLLLLIAFTASIALQEVTSIARQNQLNVIGLETRLFIYVQPYLNLVESPFQLLSSPEELSAITDVVKRARPFLRPMVNVALHGFIMVGVAFYLLRDDGQASTWALERFGDEDNRLAELMDALDHDYHQIFFGNILNALLTGLIGAVVFNGINLLAPSGLALPYPTLLGFLSGAASLVPLVGMKLVYVPATVYILGMTVIEGQFNAIWFPTLFAVGAFVLVDVIPDLVLRPYVSGKDMHTGMVMFAYVLGPVLFGWYGLFLGPMILVFVVQFNRIILPDLMDRLTQVSDPESRSDHASEPTEEATAEQTATDRSDTTGSAGTATDRAVDSTEDVTGADATDDSTPAGE